MRKIDIPADVRLLLNRFHDNGYEAFIVGGCVRDSLLNDKPKDYDITTNALPVQTEQLFADMKIIETGIKHGTVTVLLNHVPYEITTYRTDVSYTDHRHPDDVRYALTLHEDLSRRDFTVNAMAYNDTEGLIDEFNGIDDLNNGIIRCVGDPDVRFNEDALRILRCIRFACRYGFTIEENTEAALFRNCDLLKYVSVERIAAEFNEILTSKSAYDYLIRYRRIFETVITQLKDLDFRLIPKLNRKLVLRIAGLFAENEHYKAEDMLRNLHYPNSVIKGVMTLLSHVDAPLDTYYQLNKLLAEIGIKASYDVLALKKAMNLLPNYTAVRKRIRQLDESLIRRDELAVNGDDLIAMGYKGKDIGNMLDELYDCILRNELDNSREKLIEYVKKRK